MGIARNNFFNRFKRKNQIFLWIEYKKGIENLILRPLRPLSEVIIPPTSSVKKNEFLTTFISCLSVLYSL
jgi:hypothetical protein